MSSGQFKRRAQVVVVGAGPVGLFAALRLRQQGIEVRLIEEGPEQRAEPLPVVLHPQSLRLLAEVGLSAVLSLRGRPVSQLAIYSDYERRAVLELSNLVRKRAGVVTLAGDILQRALAEQLAHQGVQVEWNTRFAALEQDERAVRGQLVLEERSTPFEADFVLGADGRRSTVREAAGLRLVQHRPPQTFAFFDATTRRDGAEAQLVFTEGYGNSVYPLQAGRSRFSFELEHGSSRVPDADALRHLLSARMPWCVDALLSCDGCGIAESRNALADRFGVGRVWLAGDAAHLAGPLGMQSLNVGIDEANELALRMGQAIKRNRGPAFGAEYEARRRAQWEKLLGRSQQATRGSRAPDWASRYGASLIAALPASDADLEHLLAKLGVLPSIAPVSSSSLRALCEA